VYRRGAVFLLRGVREPAQPARAPGHAVRALRDGAAFVFRHPLLRPVFITQVVFNTSFFVLQSVYVPYAVHRLGLSSSGVGVTLATYGLGMVVGALLAPAIMRAVRLGLVIAIGPVAGLAAALVMLLTVWTPSVGLAVASFFLLGAGPVIWVISTATLRQMVTPHDLLGRATAINSLAYGSRPVGAAIGALVGGVHGAETCLVVEATGFLVQAWVIVASRAFSLVQQPPMAGESLYERDRASRLSGALLSPE
jgi:predicted MFS family arabinose efflux permease